MKEFKKPLDPLEITRIVLHPKNNIETGREARRRIRKENRKKK